LLTATEMQGSYLYPAPPFLSRGSLTGGGPEGAIHA